MGITFMHGILPKVIFAHNAAKVSTVLPNCQYILHVSMKQEGTMCVNNAAKYFIINPGSIHTSLKLIAQPLPHLAIFVEGCSTHVPWQFLIIELFTWELDLSSVAIVITLLLPNQKFISIVKDIMDVE